MASDPLYNLSFLRPEPRTSGRLLGWNVPPDELQHIPDHWFAFPEPPPEHNYLLGFVYIIFTIASLTGNGLVIWVFSSAKSLQTASNMFVINLAVCDFIMMLKTPIFIYNSFHQGFALGHLGCLVFGVMGSYTGIGAGATNALIAYDRYTVIARPMEGKMSRSKAVLIIILIWLYVTPWAVLPALRKFGRFVPDISHKMFSELHDPNWNLTFFRPEARTSEVRFLGWNVPPDQLQHIPEHWLSQPEPDKMYHYLLAAIYVLFTIIALTGNGLVIWVFIAAKPLRTPSNIFVLNLAICDFMMMTKTPIFIYNSIHNGFALGHMGCQIFGLLGTFSGIASGMTNAAIGMDRYNVITRPMEGKLTFTKALVITTLIWAYTIPWAIVAYLKIWNRFVPVFRDYKIFRNTMQSQLRDPDWNLTFFRPEARSSSQHYLGWTMPPDELKYVPEHWLSHLEPEYYMHYILAALYIIFMFFALIGNGLVIYVFMSAKSLRTPSNLFVLNLAICDFLMMTKAPMFSYYSVTNHYLNHIQCQIFGLIGTYSGIGAGVTNAVIGMDRYNVIARPMDGKLTYKKALFIVFLIWCYTLPWGIVTWFEIWNRFVPEGYLTSCTFDYLTDTPETKIFVACIFTCSYVIPMTLIIIYYSQIVKHVFAHEKALREQAKKMNVESLRSNTDANKQSAEIRIAKAAITVCFLFVASWTPYGVMSLIGAFGDKSLLTPGVTMIPACFCKMVACIDPYIYAISHPRYRLELNKRLPFLGINEKSESQTASSTATETATTTA